MRAMTSGLILIAALVLVLGFGCQSQDARPASQGNPIVHAGKAAVGVTDLRCEYLQDPLGIDVARPRLSWQLAAANPKARGQRQTAYHILVSSSPRLLEKDRGDLWNSGEVASDQSVHVAYSGQALKSEVQCYWKVRVRDQNGTWSPWSFPGGWTMGLLEPSDWNAQWIGPDAPLVPTVAPTDGKAKARDNIPDPWLRKTFELPEAPHKALMYVASVGYHELYVNGQRVGDAVLSPAVADHTHRARYVTYDITRHLRPGANAIGLWLGVSWSIYPPYKTADRPQLPIVIAQANIGLSHGRVLQVVTDNSWKTRPSPNTLLGTWNFMNFGGELYDAGREVPDWADAALDDSSWKTVRVYSPALTLSSEMIEPNRRVSRITPVAVESSNDGGYRVDMGVNFSGWVEIDVAGAPGTRVDFQFSEQPDKAITHSLRSAYIIGPAGKGTFQNRFNYGSGRWITIKGLKNKPELSDARGWLVRTDYRRAGRFECSNKLLNDIYNSTLWTYENLSLGGYVVDCPQRERMGYGGDAHATTEMAMDNYHLGAFYTKWSQDWRDVQGKESIWGVDQKATFSAEATREEGNLPYTAPTYWGGGGPGWSGYCVTLPWTMYQRYGDVRSLEQNFPTIQRWLAFLETKSENDMLVRWGGEWDFLGDWLWPGAKGVNGDTRETLFFNNCYWIYNLQTAGKIARVLGLRDMAMVYDRRADEVRRAVHATFFNPSDNSYVNGYQAYLAIALLTDVPPVELRPAVWKRLHDEIMTVRGGHIYAGITGGAMLFQTLVQANRNDLILPMVLKEDFPGWGDMLKRGATTMWESWEGDNSLLHSSYLYVGAWFVEGLGGISIDPERPGYKSFIIRPGIQPGIDWVNCSFDSMYGTIVSEWKAEDGKLLIHVRVPPNTTAKLYVPSSDEKLIRENGRKLNKAPGVRPISRQGNQTVLLLQPGDYRFEARR